MYIVNLSKYIATEEYLTPKKNIKHNTFAVFLDIQGAYILTKAGKVYLNEKNSVFV